MYVYILYAFFLGDCDKEWKVVERKKNRDVVCCATGPTKGTTEIALEDLKKEIGAESMVIYYDSKFYHCEKLFILPFQQHSVKYSSQNHCCFLIT